MNTQCKCKMSMDIRGRCDPVCDAIQFKSCPTRVDTIYFHISNDSEKYQEIEDCCSRREKQELYFDYARAEPYCLTESEEDDLTKLIEEDEKDEGDTYLCYFCDEYVSLAEECDVYGERPVCEECVESLKCEECGVYVEEGCYRDAINGIYDRVCPRCNDNHLSVAVDSYIVDIGDNLDSIRKGVNATTENKEILQQICDLVKQISHKKN